MTGMCAELIELVLGHCLENFQDPVGRSTLRSCLLVSRLFYNEALRHLVAHIPIHLDIPRATEILASLANTHFLNEYLVARIRSIAFIWSSPALNHSASQWCTVIPLFEILKDVSPQITHLSFLYTSRRSVEGVRTIPCGRVVLAILDLRIRCSSLESLTTRNLKVHPLFLWTTGNPPRLRRLAFDNSELWDRRAHKDHFTLLAANVKRFGSSDLVQALSDVDDDDFSPLSVNRGAQELVVHGQQSIMSLCAIAQAGRSSIRLPNVKVFELSLVGAHIDNHLHDYLCLKVRGRSLKKIKLVASDRVDVSSFKLTYLPAVEYIHLDFSTRASRLLHKSSVEDRVRLARRRITNLFSSADDTNVISDVTIVWEWSTDQYLNLLQVSNPLDASSQQDFPFDNLFRHVKFARLQFLRFFFAVYGYCDIPENTMAESNSQKLGLAICPNLSSQGKVLVQCETAWPSSEV